MLEVINRCINAGLPPLPPTRLPSALVPGDCAQEGATGVRDVHGSSACTPDLQPQQREAFVKSLGSQVHVWLGVKGVEATSLQLLPPNF